MRRRRRVKTVVKNLDQKETWRIVSHSCMKDDYNRIDEGQNNALAKYAT